MATEVEKFLVLKAEFAVSKCKNLAWERQAQALTQAPSTPE